ncbi:DUF2878 domain-containing protein [Pleionea sediminis]|uniref:DUF2878 domain-containing protein n=1 Tax=Pleionea sediminis TaxID=2569479 RepID=UPI001186A5B2|nr:DUF2878 domain-containing protein [Pleionea sediminis]
MIKELPLSKIVNNFLVFQLGWFMSAYWHDYRAIIANFIILLWLYYAEPWSKLRIKFTLIATSIGIASDSLLAYLGLISFDSSWGLPFWFMSLWLLFASTLSVSLSWMMRNRIFALFGGAIFGPLAYFAGVQFDALVVNGWQGFLALSVSWAILMVIFSTIYSRKPVNRMYLKSEVR